LLGDDFRRRAAQIKASQGLAWVSATASSGKAAANITA
jgi:hypothetical protein